MARYFFFGLLELLSITNRRRIKACQADRRRMERVDRAPVVWPVGPKQCLARSLETALLYVRGKWNFDQIPEMSSGFLDEWPATFYVRIEKGIAGWTNVHECKLRCPNTIGATVVAREARRWQLRGCHWAFLVTREKRSNGKARPYARLAPRGV